MSEDSHLSPFIYEGWHAYQEVLIKAIAPLDSDQLGLRAAPKLLSVGEIAAHIVVSRAAWFFFLMQEGGEEFKTIGRTNVKGPLSQNAQEIVSGLETTWTGMHAVIDRWTPKDWAKTFPDEDDDNTPDVLTRQWVIWHMIEHDLHHGGEISIMLGSHGEQGLKLSG